MPRSEKNPSRVVIEPLPNASRSAKPKARFLTPETQEIMRALEKRAGFPCLAYWTSFGGSICQNDVMAMSKLLEDRPRSKTVGLFLKSDGGNPEAALRLAHLLRNFFTRVILFAPFECASAATMMALSCNEIHMGPTSYLTAVDSSLKHDLSPLDSRNALVSVSQDEVSRILRLWRAQKTGDNPFPEVYKYLHPLVIGALDRSSSLSIRICEELLAYHMKNKAQAARISRALNGSYPSHSYPITDVEARRMGLPVRALDPEIGALLRQLNSLYATMAREVRTDKDSENYHAEEVCNILERAGRQIVYHVDKVWHYRREERRWISINDLSTWRSVEPSSRGWWARPFFIV